MAQLELSAMEATVIGDILRSALSELHTEINHTDSRELRMELKERETVVKGVLERVTAMGTA